MFPRVENTAPRKLERVRPGLQLDELSLLPGIPPWDIDASRQRPAIRGRLVWQIRAIGYRLGLRRLATTKLTGPPSE
jgi:hypothetical protein